MAAYFLSFFYFPAYFLLLEFSFFLRDCFSSISTLIFSSIFASILAALLLAFFLYLACALLSQSLAPPLLSSSESSKSSKLRLMKLPL